MERWHTASNCFHRKKFWRDTQFFNWRHLRRTIWWDQRHQIERRVSSVKEKLANWVIHFFVLMPCALDFIAGWFSLRRACRVALGWCTLPALVWLSSLDNRVSRWIVSGFLLFVCLGLIPSILSCFSSGSDPFTPTSQKIKFECCSSILLWSVSYMRWFVFYLFCIFSSSWRATECFMGTKLKHM